MLVSAGLFKDLVFQFLLRGDRKKKEEKKSSRHVSFWKIEVVEINIILCICVFLVLVYFSVFVCVRAFYPLPHYLFCLTM